jgi:hypothetical protein
MSTRGATAVAAGLTVDELAERWDVLPKVAKIWLGDFVKAGFVITDGDSYQVTNLAQRLGVFLGWSDSSE